MGVVIARTAGILWKGEHSSWLVGIVRFGLLVGRTTRIRLSFRYHGGFLFCVGLVYGRNVVASLALRAAQFLSHFPSFETFRGKGGIVTLHRSVLSKTNLVATSGRLIKIYSRQSGHLRPRLRRQV